MILIICTVNTVLLIYIIIGDLVIFMKKLQKLANDNLKIYEINYKKIIIYYKHLILL